MTCEELDELLIEYLDNRLDDRRRDAANRHLATCAACRDTAAAQTAVSNALASRPEGPVRPSFAARVSQRIARDAGWFGVADWRWLSLRLAPVAAALLVAAGIVIERQAQPPEDVSSSSVVETLAGGESDSLPVTSVLWQQDTTDDAVLLTVLAAPANAVIVRQTDAR
jgi:anti-sigma factor RsiW